MLLPVLLLAAAWPGNAAPTPQDGPGWDRARAGMDRLYNLDYDAAIAEYQKALEGEPDNVRFLNLLANAYLFRELYRLGRLDSSLYASSNRFVKEEKPKADPKEVQKVHDTLAKVRTLTQARLEDDPRDAEARYALGVANALEGTILFIVEKKFFGALRAATRANNLHEKVLEIDPEFHDAKLITGTYQYIVGSLPWTVRALAFFIGHRGDKGKGMRMVTEAMERGTVVRTDATVLLVLGYTREKNYAKARELLQGLTEQYPANYLYALEIGQSYLKEKNREKAAEVYQSILQRRDEGAPGFARVPADRLAFEIGAIQQKMGRWEDALVSFARVGRGSNDGGGGPGSTLLYAHARLERGEILFMLERFEEARAELEAVTELGHPKPARRARRLLRRIVRQKH